MRHWLVVAALAVVSPAHAESFGLACSGTATEYDRYLQAEIPDMAASVDLDGRVLSTPFGMFHITTVDDQAIDFDATSGPFKVFGRFDRSTGDLTIFWRRPEEDTKIMAGKVGQMSPFVKFHCTRSRRPAPPS